MSIFLNILSCIISVGGNIILLTIKLLRLVVISLLRLVRFIINFVRNDLSEKYDINPEKRQQSKVIQHNTEEKEEKLNDLNTF